MVSYDFSCMEGDTIGFTNMHFIKNGVEEDASGILIKLYCATSRYPSTYTEIGSGTTNNQGKVTLTGTISSSGGYYLFYGAGDQKEYLASVLVQKPATSLLLGSNKSVLSYADSESCTLTATLKDNDGETVTVDGETVLFYKQSKESITSSVSCPAHTGTVIYNGEEIISGESVDFLLQSSSNGYFSIKFEDSSHNSVSNTMSINGTYNIELSRDSDGVMITIEGGGGEYNYMSFNPTRIIITPTINCTVENVVYHNWISVGSGVTVSGVASCTYNSQGVGDVVFYAECEGIFSTETYVEDCLEYKPTITSTTSKTVTQTTYTVPFQIEGKLASTNKGYSLMVQTSTGKAIRVGVGGNDNKDIAKYDTSWATVKQLGTYTTYSTPISIKFKCYSSYCEVYIDDTLEVTINDSWVSDMDHAGIETWSTSKTMTLTDFKIKPL